MSTLSLPLRRTALRALAPIRALDRTAVLTAGALSTLYLVWGTTYLATEVAIVVLPPMLLLALRFSLAGSLLLVGTVLAGHAVAAGWTWAAWRRAAVDGLLLLGLGTGLTVLGQTRLTSGTTALLAATVPIWLALLARGMFGERLAGRAWLGLVVGIVAVGALVDPSSGHLGSVLLVLVAAGAWAAGSLRGRGDAPHLPAMQAAAMEMITAAGWFLLAAVLRGEPAALNLGAVTAGVWAAVAYLTLAGSLLAFAAYRWLLANVATTTVGTFAYVNPVIAVAVGWAVLGEPVGARTLVAGGLVLVAVALLVTAPSAHAVPAQITSGGDAFAGASRWRRRPRLLGRLPRRARLVVDPAAPQVRGVGYPQPGEPAGLPHER